ncbi:3714_t:CDS:2 [Dentiscutata erythropus]|uniref:3714_t:CDS:1 n=1 Tax=Dentiscutata erythropus TaxID=1348616 RepID=A0A9N9EMB0_9GLOM|nr:3714_t:CDS:2 [Dentiscutata erythropus]
MTSDVLNQKRKGSSLSYDPDSGYIYIFGGQSVSNSSEWFNEMIIFDSINFSWSNMTSYFAPSKRSGHTATLLKTGIIVFIGGWELSGNSSIPTLANMSQIWAYHTRSAEWSLNNAEFINNTNIGPRIYHSAVLAPDRKIIIYGGSNGINNSKVSPDLAVLNVSSTLFQWSTPNTESLSSTATRSLVGHTAMIIDSYMILLFGKHYFIHMDGPIPNNQVLTIGFIYLIQVPIIGWIRINQANASNDSTSISLLILCMVIGAAVLAFIIGFSIIWCYQKYRIKHILLTQKGTARQALRYSDDDNSTKSEEQHHYFDLYFRNFSETPVSTIYDYQQQVFQQQQQPYHFMIPVDGASYHQYQGNEGNVPVISYVKHDVQPQYVEYDTTHNSYRYPNTNPN